MLDVLKAIKMDDKMKSETILKIFKNLSRQKNAQIQQKLDQFKTVEDFFSFYTNKEINSLFNNLNTLDTALSNLLDDFSPSQNSDLDRYISCVAELCLLFKLILETNDIIKKHLISAKLYLSSNLNEYINSKNAHKKLDHLLDDFLKTSTVSEHQKSFSRKSTSEYTSFVSDLKVKKISKCNILSKSANVFCYNKSNDSFLNDKTPKFGSSEINNLKAQKSLYIQKKLYSDRKEETSSAFNFLIKGPQLSLSDFIFEDDSPKSNHIEDLKNQLRESNISDKMKPQKIELDDPKKDEEKFRENSNLPASKNISSIFKRCLKANELTKIYSYFLELITSSYKSCLITAEEKVSLKKLIMSNPQLIKNVYENNCKGKTVEKKNIINILKNYL